MMSDAASPGGDDIRDSRPSDPRHVLDRTARELLSAHLARARHWIAFFQLNPARFSEEDAVQQALVQLSQRLLTDGSPLLTPALLHCRFPRILKQVIIDESRRQHASKRMGGVISLSGLWKRPVSSGLTHDHLSRLKSRADRKSFDGS